MPLSRSRDYLSIGEVLEQVRDEFPDVSISKIRFLEAEGLIAPERTGSGYRKFYEPDVRRIRFILSLQRDHFLPLRVIRERLDEVDRGGGNFTVAGNGGAPAEDRRPNPPPVLPIPRGFSCPGRSCATAPGWRRRSCTASKSSGSCPPATSISTTSTISWWQPRRRSSSRSESRRDTCGCTVSSRSGRRPSSNR
jgi:DNA-binding transcriptional MerR regulator